MNCLVWNCHALGNPTTIYSLKWQLKHKSPQLVFLMETKRISTEVDFLIRNSSFEGFFAISCNVTNRGRHGGLLLLWDSVLEVEIILSSLHHINASINESDANNSWRFSGVYGWPEQHNKGLTWDYCG